MERLTTKIAVWKIETNDMRIAILTLPFNINYGGIIQNYALQTFLRQMGHEVETINLKKILLFKDTTCRF